MLWTVARQGPLSMGVSRQEYWFGLPCPPPGDLPNPGIEPKSPVSPALQADSLPLSHWPHCVLWWMNIPQSGGRGRLLADLSQCLYNSREDSDRPYLSLLSGSALVTGPEEPAALGAITCIRWFQQEESGGVKLADCCSTPESWGRAPQRKEGMVSRGSRVEKKSRQTERKQRNYLRRPFHPLTFRRHIFYLPHPYMLKNAPGKIMHLALK